MEGVGSCLVMLQITYKSLYLERMAEGLSDAEDA